MCVHACMREHNSHSASQEIPALYGTEGSVTMSQQVVIDMLS